MLKHLPCNSFVPEGHLHLLPIILPPSHSGVELIEHTPFIFLVPLGQWQTPPDTLPPTQDIILEVLLLVGFPIGIFSVFFLVFQLFLQVIFYLDFSFVYFEFQLVC